MEDVSETLFGLTPGSLVKLFVSEEDSSQGSLDPTIYQGYCTAFHGLKDNCDGYIILKEAFDLSNNKDICRPLLLNIPEIIRVEVIQASDNNDADDSSQGDSVIELTLTTVVVDEKQQLDLMLNGLQELDTIACTFEGKNIGRFGVVTWIIFVAKNTLLPLNINQLSIRMGDDALWNKLGVKVFSNPNLVKVFYDCRGPADYLFHQHGITIKNVFDAPVADAYLQKVDAGTIPTKFKSLSECLQSHCTVSFLDIQVLQEYENNVLQYTSAWLVQPIPVASTLKIGAVKVKHLILLRKNLVKKIMATYTTTVANHLDDWFQTSKIEDSEIVKP